MMDGRNLRLTTGLSPVYKQDEKRFLFLAALPTRGTTPACLGKPFHARHVRGKRLTNYQNLRLTRSPSAVHPGFFCGLSGE